jgi:hypothetical protein
LIVSTIANLKPPTVAPLVKSTFPVHQQTETAAAAAPAAGGAPTDKKQKVRRSDERCGWMMSDMCDCF